VVGGEAAHPRATTGSVSEVRFRRSAQADVQRAFQYYESQGAGLGVEFIKRVDEVTNRIAANPLQYQPVIEDVRRANLRQFKYSLWYRVEGDGSVVIACLANRRDLALARTRASQESEPS
jgi:plasmid stabilization system protein ParE